MRACWRTDEFLLGITSDAQHGAVYSIFSDRGRVGISITHSVLAPRYTYLDPTKPPPARENFGHIGTPPLSETTLAGSFGPMISRSQASLAAGVAHTTTFALPTPALASICVVALAWIWFDDRRARALAAVGKCQRCGYDLRATPGVCPECGPIVSDVRKAWPASQYNPMAGATRFLTERQRERSRRSDDE